ncbi:MAG: hypothetical protein ACXABY_23680, partial [Candidatus Thorarchaeota archaeon]
IQVFAQFLPPEHPVLERLIIQLGQGFDIEDMEALLQQGRQAIADEQARENPLPEAASQSETQGDVLAELLGGGEI